MSAAMANPPAATFAPQPQRPTEIADHHKVMTAALRHYYLSAGAGPPPELVGRSRDELTVELGLRQRELDHLASLAILAAVEAAMRQAYSQRTKPSAGLGTKVLLRLYQVHGRCSAQIARKLRAWLGDSVDRERLDDILDLYYKTGDQDCRSAISGYRGALGYRHWLAHGRAWAANLPRRFTFGHIYDIAEAVFVDGLGIQP